MSDLKPCPFCGGEAKICGPDDERMSYVACSNIACYCALGEDYDRDAMPDHSFATEEDATKAWNTRASADGGQEKMREALVKITEIVHAMDGGDWDEIEEAQEIAHAALSSPASGAEAKEGE